MVHFLRSLSTFTFIVLCAPVAVQAASITLYDDTKTQTPNEQDWLFAASNDTSFPNPLLPDQVGGADGVTMVTTLGESAGYSNYVPVANSFKNSSFPVLDRSLGFSLSFEVQINSEDHNSGDRAGFSVILLADDFSGIELGFWTGQVWAQNVGFTHGEGTNGFDAKTAEVSYDLFIQGSGYSLTADSTEILTGSLRDYSASGIPYQLPNYLFLGDDTSSAQANITLGKIVLATNPAAVPAPPVWAMLLLGLGLIGRRYRRGLPSNSKYKVGPDFQTVV